MPFARQETRTKIVATLGPASWDEPMLSRLLEAGVDVCRINCSHSDADAIRRQVARVRRAAMRLRQPCAILLDLQGPKIRIGNLQPVELAAGDVLTVVMDENIVGTKDRVGTTYPQMAGDTKAGDKVLFADGAVGGVVEEVRTDRTPAEVIIRITEGGPLSSHKGLNFPGVEMSVPSLTEKDIRDLEVGSEVGVDYVALSFVRRASDVDLLRSHMERLKKVVPIVAKIEKPQAVENIASIVETSEGVMVARGDLGVEVRIERVPVYQKHIIETAFRASATVITATQMLDSMERNPRPTRAETTDVANAILDGTDAVMLSGETSTGKYPLEAVRMMDSIAREVEASRFFRPTAHEALPALEGPGGSVWRAACGAALEAHRPLLVYTWSGQAAIYASKARLPVPVFALTPNPQVVDRLSLVFGVTPLLVPSVRSTDDLIDAGENELLARGLLVRGQEVVVVTGETPLKGATHMMKIARVGE